MTEFPTANENQESDNNTSTVMLMLGLYLIVLAFFILLNTMSTFSENKRQKASESISEGFGFHQEGPKKVQKDDEISIFRVYESIATEIQGKLESYLSSKEYKIEMNAEQIIIRLDPRAFFERGGYTINPVQVEFFQEMTDLLTAKRNGLYLTAEVEVHAAPSEAENYQQRADILAGRRATIFARALMERGVSPTHMTAEVIENPEPAINLLINIHVQDAQKAISSLDGLY